MHRLVVLGGSAVATPGLISALRAAGLPPAAWQVVLYGRSADKLALVGRACRAVAAGTGMGVEWGTDLAACLDGADFVLNQVRVGGLQARAFDEQFPRELGLIGEETVGAGGWANALRTIPVALELCRAVERHAPGAWLVNLSNPSSLVQQAIARYTSLKVVSGCDVPVTLAGWVNRLLDAPPGAVALEYLGTNHLGWVTAAHDRREGGRDRLPEVLARVGQLPGFPLEPELVQGLGVLPGPYLRYYYYRERFEAGGAPARTRANELIDIEAGILAAYAGLPEGAGGRAAGGEGAAAVVQALGRRRPHWYDEVVAPLLGALAGGPADLILQVGNRGLVPELGQDTVVELPVRASAAAGLEPGRPARLPPDCRALLAQNAAYEELAVAAIVEGDRPRALRALVANPLVGTADRARAVLDRTWPDPIA